MDQIPAGSPMDVAELDAILIESSTLMKQGIGLLDAAPADAIACFDRALALRRRLPIDQVPVLRYDLAACWLNRAEALGRLANDDAALAAYGEALALLRTLPLDEDPRFARRLAIACQNRGRVLASRAQGPDDMRAAIAAFVEAIGVLEQHGAGVPDRQHLMAAMWMNAAAAWMADEQEPAQTQASRAARLAIALIETLEPQDADAAEIGLHARHVLCRVLAATSLAVTPATAVAIDDVHAATDLTDEGLALVEHWERHGVTRFRALACDLFRFGAYVYAVHQPGFLPEFVQEHLDPARSSPDYVDSMEMRRAADDTSSLQPGTYYVTLAVHME